MTNGISLKNLGHFLRNKGLRERVSIWQPPSFTSAIALPQAISAGFGFSLMQVGLSPIVADTDGFLHLPFPAQIVLTTYTALASSAATTYTETTVTDGAAWSSTGITAGDIVTVAGGIFGKIITHAASVATVGGWYSTTTGLKVAKPADTTIATTYPIAAAGVIGSTTGEIVLDGITHTGLRRAETMTKSQTTSAYARQVTGTIYRAIKAISISAGTNIASATHASIGFRAPTSSDGNQGQFWRIPIPDGMDIKATDIDGVVIVNAGGGVFYPDIQGGGVIRSGATIGINSVSGATISATAAEPRSIAFASGCSTQPTSAVEFMLLLKDRNLILGQ